MYQSVWYHTSRINTCVNKNCKILRTPFNRFSFRQQKFQLIRKTTWEFKKTILITFMQNAGNQKSAENLQCIIFDAYKERKYKFRYFLCPINWSSCAPLPTRRKNYKKTELWFHRNDCLWLVTLKRYKHFASYNRQTTTGWLYSSWLITFITSGPVE